MKRTIAIVAGGDTSEFHVSLRSAQGIYSFIDKEKYTLYIVEMHGLDWHVQLPGGTKAPVDRNDFSFRLDGEKIVFDFAYITIHGTPGEDGRLQGYFDMLHIPYSCCGVLAASLTYDKFACNQYLKAFGVRIAESLMLRQGQSVSNRDVLEKIGLPCFIKPSLGGSSFGVTKVKTEEQIQPAIAKAFEEAQEVVVEAFMDGTEITCGCYKTKDKAVVFPITEVVTHNEYFDYKEKYESRIADLAVEMEQLEDGLRTMDAQTEQHRALEQDAAQIKTDRALTGALIERLIDRIEVSHDKQITVRYRFQSEFETYAEVLEQCRNM